MVVVGGANIFVPCMEYLELLSNATKNKLKIKIAINDYYQLSEEQTKQLNEFTTQTKIKDTFNFTISNDKNQSTQNKINEVLKSGEGLEKNKHFY